MSRIVGWNVTIRTYVQYEAGEDDAIGNNKSPEQLRAEVKAMTKSDVLDVLDSVRGGISVTEAHEDDVTVEYYEEGWDDDGETEYEQHAHEGY